MQETENQKGFFSKNIIALSALFVSVSSIALQFFYERYKLTVTVYDVYYNEGKVTVKMLFQNKGNQDVTLVKSVVGASTINIDTTNLFKVDLKDRNIKKESITLNRENDSARVLKPKEQLLLSNTCANKDLDSILNTVELKKIGNFNAKIDLSVVFIDKNGNINKMQLNIGTIFTNTKYRRLRSEFKAKQNIVYSSYGIGY